MTYPVFIIQDRYSGSYSNGKWIAIGDARKNFDFVYNGAHSDDITCSEFWRQNIESDYIGIGNTPDEALADLMGDKK